MKTRRAYSNLDGSLATSYADDEICVILDDETRVALLKLIGACSRRDMLERKLSEHEAQLVELFYHILQ